jgi:DNA-binding beta-propeller fold protein YncE
VAADAAPGNVWVADTKNNRLLELTSRGTQTGRTVGDKQGSAPGQFFWPLGMTVAGGLLVVADTNNNRVVCIDPDGPTVLWTAGGMNKPSDVYVSGGTAYVADTGNKRIVLLDMANGAVESTIVDAAKIHSPQGVAADSDGNVWVADTTWNKLVEFDPAGNFIQGFGSRGSATDQFNNPTKLDFSAGLLYVADQWNDRVEVFTIP